MKGYKATDKDMKCRGFQYELGKWYEHNGEVATCESGFHFCEQPSGPWAYYSEPGTRIFEIEADDVLNVPFEPGADFKRVAKRIRLVKEITPTEEKQNTGNGNTGNGNTGDWNTGDWNTGNGNTGNRNTGDWNTGYWNTGNGNTGNGNTGNRNTGDWNTGNGNAGDWNTGDWNTGDWNTGNWNTGNGNTGNRNTGNRNTGNRNTGDWNTGNRNTGNRNTGDWNTGNWNTGNWNTGYGNAANFSAGFFCTKEPKVICFDVQTEFTRSQFVERFPEYRNLFDALLADNPIDFEPFKNLPGITRGKLKALHNRFIEGRKKKK